MTDFVYTELDDLAYELICLQSDKNNKSRIIGKPYFVYNKDYFPYVKYYDEARIQIRMIKLKKIKDEIQSRRQIS